MPTNLTTQLTAKYKNSSFLIRKETLNEIGQKRIRHEYPNTSSQYMEAKGTTPFNSTIEIFFSGPNYKENFAAFKKDIEDPSPGRLFMPTFGLFNNVVATPATAESSQSSLGEITLSVNFSETIQRPSPISRAITIQDVSELAQELRTEIKNQFSLAYVIPTTISNIATSLDDALNIGDSVNKITGAVKLTNDFLSQVSRVIKDADAYAELLLKEDSPVGYIQSLVTAITGPEAFNTFKDLSVMGNTLSNSMHDIRALISPTESSVVPAIPSPPVVNKDIAIWKNDTFERKQRNQSRLSSVNTYRLVGLIGMFESAAARSYTTTNQIDEISKTLENQYEELIENDTTGVIIPSIKSQLDNLRSLADEVLKEKRQQAYIVIETFVEKPMSASLLTYDLYGEYIKNENQLAFLAELITGLNSNLPAYRLEGIVKVVEIG